MRQRYAAIMKEEMTSSDFVAQRVRACLLFLAPPPLEETPLASRTTSLARRVTVRLVVSPFAVALSASSAASGANTALDRSRSRSDSRAVVVRVGIRGAGTRSEERIRGRTGVAPGPGTGVTAIRAWVLRSAGAGGVVADAVVHGGGAGCARVEEVDGAAGGLAVGGTDDGERVAEDVADVEVAGRVRLEYCPVCVRPAVGAHVGYADLTAKAGTEVGAAHCRAGVGVAVERVVGILSVAGPGYG